MRFQPFRRSIADYASEPENNYRLLRFLAALMVVYGHSYAIAPVPGQRDLVRRLLGFTFSGGIGMDTLFVISGFLITASYLNRSQFGDFMKSRCLRVFPGLIVCLLVTVFVLGPAVSTLGASAYLTRSDLYVGLFRNLVFASPHFRLPGVFEGLPQSGVNGSLWTLPPEFALYIVIAVFGMTGFLQRPRAYLFFVLFLAVVAVVMNLDIPALAGKVRYMWLFILFGTGSAIRVYSHRIPLSTFILIALAVPVVLLLRTPAAPHLFNVWLVYAVFWAAYVPRLYWFNRLGDYSYGLYIYAFPIEQTLRQYFEHIQPLQLCAAGSVLALACGVISWHFVEAPALKLKGKRSREIPGSVQQHKPAAASLG